MAQMKLGEKHLQEVCSIVAAVKSQSKPWSYLVLLSLAVVSVVMISDRRIVVLADTAAVCLFVA